MKENQSSSHQTKQNKQKQSRRKNKHEEYVTKEDDREYISTFVEILDSYSQKDVLEED